MASLKHNRPGLWRSGMMVLHAQKESWCRVCRSSVWSLHSGPPDTAFFLAMKVKGLGVKPRQNFPNKPWTTAIPPERCILLFECYTGHLATMHYLRNAAGSSKTFGTGLRKQQRQRQSLLELRQGMSTKRLATPLART